MNKLKITSFIFLELRRRASYNIIMNFLKPLAFTITFLTSTFLTSVVPAQQKFVELSPLSNSKQVSETVVKAAAEKFFSELSDEYFLDRYYSAIEENPANVEKSNLFEIQTADLNGDGRVELFVGNKKLSISGNYQTVVYEIGENNTLTKLLETDGVFSVSASAAAGGYKIIRTNRHESAAERSIAEFIYNPALGEYQQRAKAKLIKNKK
jgi:hypothetical protein